MKLTSPRQIGAAIACAALIVATGVVANSALAAAATTIVVNYGSDVGAANQVASGFLHGISATSPAQYLIDGVTVKALRGADHHPYLPSLFDPATYRRAAATGAALKVGLYYYTIDTANPNHTYRPGDNGDFATWVMIVNGVMNEAERNGYRVGAWIPWNEPDLQWRGRYTTTYFQAHKKAYDAVKARNPRYQVEAPELSSFNMTTLTEFLTYCRDHNCLPDVLAWHELKNAPTDVPAHTAQIRSWMQANGITPMPIAITEYQGNGYGAENAWDAGLNVRWLAQMERGVRNGLQDALYSSWDYLGTDSHFVATLGNAADKTTGTLPKGVWWNYNAYKTMTGRMVGVTSSADTTVDAFGAADPALHRSVLLIGNQTSSSQPVTLKLSALGSVAGLSLFGKAHVHVEQIKNSATLDAPTVAIDQDVALPAGNATVALGSLVANGAFKVLITPGTAAAPTTAYEAESLSSTATNGMSGRVFSEVDASAGRAVSLDATGVGQYIEFTVPVTTTGVYDLRAVLKRESSRGLQALYVDGKQFGAPQDEHGSRAYHSVEYGTLPLTTGNHTLRFVTVGRNPSSSGYTMVFDRFELAKLG